MKSTQRVRRINLTEFLTFGPNALIRLRSGNDYKIITATELAKLDVTTLHQELTTTKTVTADESGTHFVLNTATAFVTTLPALAVGLEYFFHIGATAPTTTHTIVTNGSANVIEGNITSPDDANGSVSITAAADTISFVASKSLRGDYAHVYCDGVNWFLDGMTIVFDGMTTTQAS
jgi:hypothetical protein